MICLKHEKSSAELAAKFLREGKIVILPTDTVYGFSGIVGSSFDTEKKICEIKGRAESKPCIQLISTPDDVKKYTNTAIPEFLLNYWPGPLTLIVKNKNSEKTTAFRCPGDFWLRNVISLCNSPIYSTSVNRSGKPVLQKISDIVDEFESECDLIVDFGDCNNSLPSTIISLVDFTENSGLEKIKIVRQGSLEIKEKFICVSK